MAGFSISLAGADKLIKLLRGFKGPLSKDVDNGLQRMGMQYEGLVKKATPVDTGQLRASITTERQGAQVAVGTNVEYASFVEYGTSRMGPRHVEGTQSRVMGKGPFTYALEQFKDGVKNGAKSIAKDVEHRFSAQKLRGFNIGK